MSLIIRLLLVLIASPFRQQLRLGDASHVRTCVLPNDLDLNMHMTNGRYLTMLDLGRIDLIVRLGFFGSFMKHKWRPLVAGVLIRYRFGLRPFESIVISSRLLCWDDKWVYFEDLILSRRGVAAIALTKMLIRGGANLVSPSTILEVLGLHEKSPTPPEAILRWLRVEESLHIN